MASTNPPTDEQLEAVRQKMCLTMSLADCKKSAAMLRALILVISAASKPKTPTKAGPLPEPRKVDKFDFKRRAAHDD